MISLIGLLRDLLSTVASEVAYLALEHLLGAGLRGCVNCTLKACFQQTNLLLVGMEFQDMLSLLIILSDVLCHRETNQSGSNVYILNGIYSCNRIAP